MGNPAMAAILRRAETPAEIAALIISTETAGECLAHRLQTAQAQRQRTITVSCDELHEHADRLFRLAGIARQHHATLTQGRRLTPATDPAFRTTSWRDRARAWWRAWWPAFVRNHIAAEGPADG